MLFGEAVYHIVNIYFPFCVKLLLCRSISEPIIFHIPALCMFDQNFWMHETIGYRVISDDWNSPTSQSILYSYIAVVKFWKIPPHLASTAEEYYDSSADHST